VRPDAAPQLSKEMSMASNVGTLTARGSSSRRALMIALVCGAVAALLAFAFLNKQSSVSIGTTVPVVVAAQDIPLGGAISASNVTVRAVASADKHPLAFTDKTKNDAIGQVALEPLSSGQQVLSSEVTKDKAQVGLSALIPSGHRAIGITVSEVTTGGGFIQPGDYVDVIGTFQVNAAAPANDVLVESTQDQGSKHYVGVTLLQNVKVLAIGQTAVQPQQVAASGDAKNLQPSQTQAQAKSVTLALTPDEAQRVFLAEEIGTLRLAERPLGDTAPVSLQPTDNSLQQLPAPPSGQ
jgi:pilus assembly protein CpaB